MKKKRPPMSGRRIALLRDLANCRRHLQSLDESVVSSVSNALSGRMANMDTIVGLKKELDFPTEDPVCEKAKLRKLKRLARDLKIPWEFLEPIYLWLFARAKAEQARIANTKTKGVKTKERR